MLENLSTTFRDVDNVVNKKEGDISNENDKREFTYPDIKLIASCASMKTLHLLGEYDGTTELGKALEDTVKEVVDSAWRSKNLGFALGKGIMELLINEIDPC